MPDSNREVIYVSKLVPDAVLPTRKFSEDAGMDVYAVEDVQVLPLSWAVVKTGITFSIPKGYCILAKPKSRHNYLVGAGVIEANYQGEMLIKIVNPTNVPLEIKKGVAIAQLLLVPVITPGIKELPLAEIHPVKSDRGGTGGIVNQAK